MFESRKRKKAEEEFQSRYNLTDDEMAQISFVKVPNLVMLRCKSGSIYNRISSSQL